MIHEKLNSLNIKLIEVEKNYKDIEQKTMVKASKFEELKEKSIRKDTQIEELTNFLKTEENNIEDELNIKLEENNYLNNKHYDVDIKELESKLKKFKFRIDEYDDINFSAEKDAIELEQEVNELDIEEKDLTKAAKKLEKAIEELKIQYFKRRSSVIFQSLPIESQNLLSSPAYQQVFESIQANSNSVEYYLIDESGSFLFLDQCGEPTWFVVRKYHDIQAQYQLAEGLGVPEAILNLLRGHDNLLFMLSIEDERQPPERWGDYIHPAEALSENHCYAVITNRTKNKLQWNKVCCYQA